MQKYDPSPGRKPAKARTCFQIELWIALVQKVWIAPRDAFFAMQDDLAEMHLNIGEKIRVFGFQQLTEKTSSSMQKVPGFANSRGG